MLDYDVYESLNLGQNVFISWNVQIHNTDYHYFITEEIIFPRNKKIEISDNVWIVRDVTVSKVAIIPSNSIIASHSLVYGKNDNSETGMLIAGVPAKVIRFNIRPINDYNKDSQIDVF